MIDKIEGQSVPRVKKHYKILDIAFLYLSDDIDKTFPHLSMLGRLVFVYKEIYVSDIQRDGHKCNKSTNVHRACLGPSVKINNSSNSQQCQASDERIKPSVFQL